MKLSDFVGKTVARSSELGGELRLDFTDGTVLIVKPSDYDHLVYETEVRREVVKIEVERVEVEA